MPAAKVAGLLEKQNATPSFCCSSIKANEQKGLVAKAQQEKAADHPGASCEGVSQSGGAPRAAGCGVSAVNSALFAPLCSGSALREMSTCSLRICRSPSARMLGPRARPGPYAFAMPTSQPRPNAALCAPAWTAFTCKCALLRFATSAQLKDHSQAPCCNQCTQSSAHGDPL